MKTLPRCCCVTASGQQCFRRVTDGSQPPICHIHKAQQQGQGHGPAVPPANAGLTPLDIVRKLAYDRGNPKQLEALKVLIELDPSTKPKWQPPDHRPTIEKLKDLVERFAQRRAELGAAKVEDRGDRILRTLIARLNPDEPIDVLQAAWDDLTALVGADVVPAWSDTLAKRAAELRAS